MVEAGSRGGGLATPVRSTCTALRHFRNLQTAINPSSF
jgi:hypothetical protein